MNDPTLWCSNTLCRESPSKFRVCMDPSQTIKKLIKQLIDQEIKFVGRIITADGINADPEKVDAIINMKASHDKTSLLRFIGMINDLSPYFENMNSVIRPLTELTKKICRLYGQKYKMMHSTRQGI